MLVYQSVRDFGAHKQQFRIMDVFCGGFGGWSFAAKALTMLGVDSQIVAAVDHDRYAIANHQANHGGVILHDAKYVPTMPRDWPVHLPMGIETRNLLQLSHKTGVNMASVSFPCQPWSWSGTNKGLHSEEGRVSVRAFGLLKLIRSAVILLENVANIVNHDHFAMIKRVISWAGLQDLLITKC